MPSSLLPSGTKGDLLLLMKRQGPISLDDAEAATGLTRPTLRQHLGGLERDRLVERSTQRQPRGRPSLRYALTPQAEALFPSRDGVLLGRLLDFLQERDDDALIEGFFEHYWDERLRDVQHRLSQVPEGDGDERLSVLVELLREQGFMPEVRSDEGGLVIRECNCPFPEAVKRTRLPCRLEARFFERVFDDRISRVTYIPDGFPACTYEFPASEEAGAP
ncbi:MAG: transcriptional regulator [Rhodothermales bacterium]